MKDVVCQHNFLVSPFKLSIMQTKEIIQNWSIGLSSSILDSIHQEKVNIAIYERTVDHLSEEINSVLSANTEFRSSGDVATLVRDLQSALQGRYPNLLADIEKLLGHFVTISDASNFRILLATINNNMCRKFHTDINDIRMLCTYSGPGTLWLTDDNINEKALDRFGDNQSIVMDESKVRQASTGDVILLKGAIYPNDHTKACVHRSPTIEESGERRLLLRIDTNEFLNFN